MTHYSALWVHNTLHDASTTKRNLRWDCETPATRLLVRPTLSGDVIALTDIPPPVSDDFLGRAEIKQSKLCNDAHKHIPHL
jgi:hypothetical protein